MVAVQRMDPATYERLAVFAEYKLTELWDGVPVEKPVMSQAHGDAMADFAIILGPQIDRSVVRLRINHAKLAVPGGNYFIPDLAILPADVFGDPAAADLFHDPALLVVEVWSPTTGDYDMDVKIPGYLARGDAEVWRLHPFERSVVRWVRLPDGRYEQSRIAAGTVRLAALPEIAVDLDALFG